MVIGEIGLSGTGILLEEARDALRSRFSDWFAERTAKRIRERMIPSSLMKKYEKEASALMQMGSGGFLTAVWVMSEVSGTGFAADLRKVPVCQETIEICEALNLDPYKLWSQGTYLAGAREPFSLADAVRQEGWEAEVIGSVVPGRGRILRSGSITRYLDRPEPDDPECRITASPGKSSASD